MATSRDQAAAKVKVHPLDCECESCEEFERLAAESAEARPAAYPPLTRWQRFCWWLAAAVAPKDGSRYGPSIFGRSVKHDA